MNWYHWVMLLGVWFIMVILLLAFLRGADLLNKNEGRE